jgi:hypothetical protein
MKFKENISKIIIWGNVAIVIGLYMLIFLIAGLQSNWIYPAFGITFVQVCVCLFFAVALSVAHLITKRKYSPLKKTMQAFWVSSALVVLISFPTCMAFIQIQVMQHQGL